MIKILSTEQIRELDRHTIEHEPIRSIDLMERACVAFVDWYFERFQSFQRILIVCGTGNNGGDGLGITRMLSHMRFDVTVCLVQGDLKPTSDYTTNLNRLPATVKRIDFQKGNSLPESDVLIDALFGSGLSRPVDGIWADAVLQINQAQAKKIAVDIPSGLYADSNSTGPFVQADYTISFQLPKLAFLLPQNENSVGKWNVVDIGLSKKFIEEAKTLHYLVDAESIRKLIKPRNKFSHKGSFGHSLIVAGSYGKIGANVLATRAALRAGSGLVTSFVPKCGYSIIQSSVPEAMVLTDSDETILTTVPDVLPFTSIGIGPGLGRDAKTVSFLKRILSQKESPCVLDADALNILSYNLDIQNLIPENSILTPHPGEFKRLVGDWKNDFEKLKLLCGLSDKLKSIVVLKGSHSAIALPHGALYFNPTGNPAMATGGSGDVLTGILTALLAQGYRPTDAALIGVYVHGLAGDLAAKKRFSVIASDIIEEIPAAFAWVTSISSSE